MGVVETDGNTNDGDEELANQHTKGTDNENWATTESLNSPEGEGGRADVDEGENERDQERVLDGASRLEEGSGVVEDEVDTSPKKVLNQLIDTRIQENLPLLHHLKRSTKDGSAEVRLCFPEAALETVGPAAEPGGVGDESTLVFLIGNNLSQLGLDELGVGGLATNAAERRSSSVDSASLDKVSRRVGKEHKTTAKDNSPDELKTDGDAVGGLGLELLGAVDDTGGEEETDGDAELISGNEGTTDLARAL